MASNPGELRHLETQVPSAQLATDSGTHQQPSIHFLLRTAGLPTDRPEIPQLLNPIPIPVKALRIATMCLQCFTVFFIFLTLIVPPRPLRSVDELTSQKTRVACVCVFVGHAAVSDKPMYLTNLTMIPF